MKFVCPHCHQPFEIKTRKASRSEKANAARKRNAALGGPRVLVPTKVLAGIYCRGTNWTGTRFKEQIEQETGKVYSLVHACRLLDAMGSYEASISPEIWRSDRLRDAWFDQSEDQKRTFLAEYLKDAEGIKSNCEITLLCAQAIDSIRKTLAAGDIEREEADRAISKFELDIKEARAWADAYQEQGTKFKADYDVVQEKLKAGQITTEEADQELAKIRAHNLVARDKSAAAARSARDAVLRAIAPYL